MKKFASYLTHVLLGAVFASKAGAAVVVPAQQADLQDDVWQNLRKHLQGTASSSQSFDFQLPDPTTTPEALPVVYTAIRQSYLVTETSAWIALDNYWTDHPKVKASPVVFQEFLSARLSLQTKHEGTRDEIMRNWLHNAHHKPGHYDNGGGNGDDNDCGKKCGGSVKG